MGGTTELSGPDLEAGIALTDLVDGKPLVGHAHGEAIVVVRRGDVVHAVGATCTHYSGPLGDGLVVGDTIRCPWHHACFDLTNGDPIGAPALSPIACYDVALDSGKLRVGHKRAPAKPAAPRSSPSSILIIGAGAAGTAAVEELRRRGYHGSITVIGSEAPVDRPNLSKDYLAGNAPEEWLPLRTADDWHKVDVELIEATVESIDRDARRARLADGRSLSYDALLLATGAEPIRLKIPGADLPHVHTLRTLTDSRAIVAAAASGTGKRVVVIGASFIGLEAAASLKARGCEVTVVGRELIPLARVLGDEVGRFIQSVHVAHGITFALGRSPTKITATAVELDDGATLPADVVVFGVGVQPRTALAASAGLHVDNGVVVDDQLRANAPGIWAAGDIARYPDPATGELIRVEHWVAAERQGQAAARNMLGVGAAFKDVPFFWSAHYDVTVGYVGHSTQADSIEIDGDLAAHDATIVFKRAGRVEAVATIGRDLQSLRIEAALHDSDLTALAAALAQPH